MFQLTSDEATVAGVESHGCDALATMCVGELEPQPACGDVPHTYCACVVATDNLAATS